MTNESQKQLFEQWLTRYKPLLFKVVRSYAFNVMDQEDLFQEICVQVWRSIPSFRGESSEATWLYRLALNCALKYTRKRGGEDSKTQSLESVEPILQETGALMDERLAWLYEQIANLDPVDRSITLLLLEGFSYKEMSSILGITESNVGVKINRIKKYLVSESKKDEHHGI